MENKILGWTIAEIRQLIDMINAGSGDKLLPIFSDFAEKNNRKVYSVRNFYYRLIDICEKDGDTKAVLTRAGIMLPKTNHFDIREERKILLSLLPNNGKSVRKTCFELNSGDEVLAIRMQNKYRNLLKNNPSLTREVYDELLANGQKCRINFADNIIKIPSETPAKLITEDEINSLFWGLVRLVKRSAENDLEIKQNMEIKLANTALQKTTLDVKRKEVLIRELEAQNKALSIEVKEYKQQLKNTKKEAFEKYREVCDLLNSNQMSELRSFVSGLLDIGAKSGKKH